MVNSVQILKMNFDELLTLEDVEKAAKQQLPLRLYLGISSGALYEETIQENLYAFKRYKIRPRVLKDVSNRDTSTTILGHKIDFPIGISPSSLHKLSHPEGETGTAKAAAASNIPMTIAMVSSILGKDIMKTCPSLIAFQQILITRPKTLTEKFVRAAEANNVKGLVVTVDYTIFPIKLTEIRNKVGLQSRLEKYGRSADDDIYKLQSRSFESVMDVMFNGTTTWNDIRWLKSITHIPVIIKGILTAEDAKEALAHGADAIWVSNHGGRTLDSTPASIDVLSEVVQAVDGKCEVYIDSGFRTGLDVFKALALGARAVFVGRPIPYGLSVGGEMGVKKVLDILCNELDNTMALAGCKTLSDITAAHVKTYCNECKL